ncbi:MAG TPA: type II toxin-antitoxin system HicA family toxin [Solirubrobacteraceae bacterium]|nr:type II toxin-antitoxin system HicA family toxin [Solirubrobacteraceae bacterium]
MSASAATGGPGLQRPVPGALLVTPRAHAFLLRGPVRVVVRVPAGTTRLHVELNKRAVSARFRRVSARKRVAVLTRRNGVRSGRNHLLVEAQRGRLRTIIQASTFVLAPRRNWLARLQVKRGPVTSVRVRLHRATSHETVLAMWLNGHAVTPAARRTGLRSWTASLSATQWLRYGANHLRVRVIQHRPARWTELRRAFTIKRTRPLAAAGWDQYDRAGLPVQLSAARSRTGLGAVRLGYRWRVVRQPRGSRVRLRNPDRVQLRFVPRRPGTYTFALTVTRQPTAKTVPLSPLRSASSSDRVTITATPDSLLEPFKVVAGGGAPGIQVGGTFYPNKSPGHKSMQWLTLNRSTLAPENGDASNTWFDGSADGVKALRKALDQNGNINQLVILAFPRGNSAPAVPSGQRDAFNDAVKLLGVGPIPDGLLQDSNQLTILGIPHSEPGVGWYTHGGGLPDEMSGWLMPDATTQKTTGQVNYRFQPTRIPFNTSAAATATTNTVKIGDKQLQASLPAGATGGFQVEKIDPIDFTPSDRREVFVTNGAGDPTAELNRMAQFLNDQAGTGFDMVVQSIGTVKQPASNNYQASAAWRNVADAISRFGANPDEFNRVDGKYAFLGGPQLSRGAVAQSSTALPVDPQWATPTTCPNSGQCQSGTLNGLARMQSDGAIAPVVADSSHNFDDKLYEIAFRNPTPWPDTDGRHADQYAAALEWITKHLPDMTTYGSNVREAYTNPNIDWDNEARGLSNLAYPDTTRVCPNLGHAPAADPPASGGDFTFNQYCDVHDELLKEFGWVATTKKLFDNYTAALTASGANNQTYLETLAQQMKEDLNTDNNDRVVSAALSFVESILALTEKLTGPAGHVLAFFSSAYELGTAIAADVNNDRPISDQIDTKVADLGSELQAKVSGTEDAMFRIWQVIVTDYGRLSTLGPLANSKDWSFDPPSVKGDLTTSSNAWLSSELFPVGYSPWYLWPSSFNTNPTADNCGTAGRGKVFGGAAPSTQMTWEGPTPPKTNQYDLFKALVLGKKSLPLAGGSGIAPGAVTDRMFNPIDQNGFGIDRSQFVWETYPEISYQYCEFLRG